MSLRIDVIRLTGDAGFGATLTHEHLDALTRLVDMAKAAEREACAKVCEAKIKDHPPSETLKLINYDTAEARIDAEIDMATGCASAIRARGTP